MEAIDNMKDAIIIDLDNTLCNCDHRKDFLKQRPVNFKGFSEHLGEDIANEWCVKLINRFKDDHEIIYITGRPEEYRDSTRHWFFEQRIVINSEVLFMRKDGDFRPDYEIKEDIYFDNIKNRYNIVFAIDDREAVVKMWRKNEIICLSLF